MQIFRPREEVFGVGTYCRDVLLSLAEDLTYLSNYLNDWTFLPLIIKFSFYLLASQPLTL